MPSLYKDPVTRAREALKSNQPLPIKILSSGLSDNPYGLPAIFIGHVNHRILLFPGHITQELLAEMFDKILRDNNRQSAIELLNYIGQNDISFWDHYKNTELGTRVMATILGQND